MLTNIVKDAVKRHGDSFTGVYLTFCTYLCAKLTVICGTEIDGIVTTLKQSKDLGELVSKYADIGLVGMLGASSGLATLAAGYLAISYLGKEESINMPKSK